MKYSSHIIKTYIIIFTVTSSSCWEFFPSLMDYSLVDSIPEIEQVKNEYIYGDCMRRDKHFYTHVHLDSAEVVGKIILRGWLDIKRIPTCIILRGTSADEEEDSFRSTAYSFQLCVPRVTFCHSQRRYKYYYYEWYIPYDMISGMNWDMYFYGPDNHEWD